MVGGEARFSFVCGSVVIVDVEDDDVLSDGSVKGLMSSIMSSKMNSLPVREAGL